MKGLKLTIFALMLLVGRTTFADTKTFAALAAPIQPGDESQHPKTALKAHNSYPVSLFTQSMLAQTDPRNIRHGKVTCRVADAGACWGADPTEKSPLKKPSFWISEAIIATDLLADNYITRKALHAGVAQEANPILGKHPSDMKLNGFTVVGFGVQTSLNFMLANWYGRAPESRFWKYTAEYGIAGAQTAISVPVVAHNWHVYHSQCKAAGIVCQ